MTPPTSPPRSSRSPLSQRDPAFVARVLPLLRLVVRTWFRSEVHGMERVPEAGGALLVSNHSGGIVTFDVPIIAVAFFDRFGTDRRFFFLAHDLLFGHPAGRLFLRSGLVPASRETAQEILTAGDVTLVFPGGDYDVLRPTSQANVIDFDGRRGYVRTALAAGVPIVPIVSIGGQEAALFLSRGERIARLWPFITRRLRTAYAPVQIGLPFGLSVGGIVWPLPTKITTQVLEPIDLAQFGEDPDVAEVDAEVRRRMQQALDELKTRRRFPVLG